MELPSQARINSPNVIYDIFEGEVVVVHLTKGNYFSLRGAAACLWQLLAKCQDIGKIIAACERNFVSDPEVVLATKTFLMKLSDEDLVVAIEPDEVELTLDVDEIKSQLPQTNEEPFLPEIERYSDMQALLALDPIHDTSAEGWPKKKE